MAEALSAAGPEPIQAEVAAAAAKERRGDKSDDTMSGDDLAAAVKFVHLKDSLKGWSAFNTKGKRVAYNPVNGERLNSTAACLQR